MFCILATLLVVIYTHAPAQTDTPTETPTPTPTFTPWPYNPDLNGDRYVDMEDLLLFQAAWHHYIHALLPTNTPTATPTTFSTHTPTETPTPTPTRTATETPEPLSLVDTWTGHGFGNGSPAITMTIHDEINATVSLGGTFNGTYTFFPKQIGGSFAFSGTNGPNSLTLDGELDTVDEITGNYNLQGSVVDFGTFYVDRVVP